MSVIRRLTNLAKGYLKTLDGERSSSDLEPSPSREGRGRDRPPEPSHEPRPEPETPRQRLDRALAEGVLTPDEHAAKVAELDRPPTPRKRTL